MLEAALVEAPLVPRLHYGRGCLLQSMGSFDEAITAFLAATALEPEFADAWYGLGTVHHSKGDVSQASDCFERVLTIQPEHAAARHLLAAIRHECSDMPPSGFVRSLFDSYANRYDSHLTDRLEYRAHMLVEGAVVEALAGRRDIDALDVGCGTGLFGERIRAIASRLVGVDVSPGMILKASERRCYDSLEEAELTEFLKVIPAESFDVIAAVDVFSYVGAIDRIVEHAWRALRVDGLLAFTVEAGDGEYELHSSGRYRHGKRYLDRVRERANYRDVSCTREPIRSEAGLPCEAFITVWRRGPSEGSVTSSLEK